VRFYSTFVKSGDLCFDVGANLGTRTEAFLRLRARVVAIEPQDYCIGMLRKKYGNNMNVHLVQAVLGEREGESELMICSAHTLSSISNGWIQAVRESGRFSQYRWDRKVTVPMLTLDKLITEYGAPAFCKIDVEGAESQVLRGLHIPLTAISVEYTPEFLQSSLDSIDQLQRLGSYLYNYGVGEPTHLELNEWVSSDEMKSTLQRQPLTGWGDVYAILHDGN
jgi:FkbM family methyltransferase